MKKEDDKGGKEAKEEKEKQGEHHPSYSKFLTPLNP